LKCGSRNALNNRLVEDDSTRRPEGELQRERTKGMHVRFPLGAAPLFRTLIGSIESATFIEYGAMSNTYRTAALLGIKLNRIPFE